MNNALERLVREERRSKSRARERERSEIHFFDRRPVYLFMTFGLYTRAFVSEYDGRWERRAEF